MEKSVGADEASRRLDEIIDETIQTRDHFIIERSGHPVAAIVSIADYHAWQRLAKDRIFAVIEDVWQLNKGVAPEELERDVELASRIRRRNHTPRVRRAI